jgi:CheY-like chemotaxis protein
MTRVKLIHWKESEIAQRTEKLRACGYEVDHEALDGGQAFSELRSSPPSAVVIDLSRLPSNGRDVAILLRRTKATRHVPIVFVEGETDKVARIRELLPDAVYTTWGRIRGALKRAITKTSVTSVVPDQMAGYSGTPLPRKLGIKEGSILALINAPPDFSKILGELPVGVTVKTGSRSRRDLTIWFPKSVKELEDRIDRLAEQVGGGGIWIAWPKKASGVKTDLTQTVIRKIGLAAGLVDYKICAIDVTWSGLKFTRRKTR